MQESVFDLVRNNSRCFSFCHISTELKRGNRTLLCINDNLIEYSLENKEKTNNKDNNNLSEQSFFVLFNSYFLLGRKRFLLDHGSIIMPTNYLFINK